MAGMWGNCKLFGCLAKLNRAGFLPVWQRSYQDVACAARFEGRASPRVRVQRVSAVRFLKRPGSSLARRAGREGLSTFVARSLLCGVTQTRSKDRRSPGNVRLG